MSHYTNLQQPLKLGNLKLKNRVLMSALARNRGVVPKEIHIEYYSQRAEAGFIISEAILIEPQGSECLSPSGLWSKKQVEAWKKVTDGVHSKGGIIFAQLVHFGRVANTLHNQGIPPPEPSAIRANAGEFNLLVGKPGYSTPKTIYDPKEYIQLYKRAAENAKLAGFDGVELHAGGGYLPAQFLESHSNIRTDNYGGNIENRSKFILETIDALQEVYDKNQIGIKLCPSGGYNGSGEGSEDKIVELYSYLINEIDSKDIGYFQLTRHSQFLVPTGRGTPVDIQEFRPLIKNALLFANTRFTAEEGNNYVGDGKADAITYGMPFITNPDLPYRFFNGIPLNVDYNRNTFYDYPKNQPHIGYTDYPAAHN